MQERFVFTHSPAPVLNRPNFNSVFGGIDGISIPLNERNLPEAFEFVALPNTPFQIIERKSEWIAQVQTESYPESPLFLDLRFTTSRNRKKETPFPSHTTILKRMEEKIGTPYVWGGNWSLGIPEMLRLYPPKSLLSREIEILWTLRGVDCSGLLYEASEGKTPRNTKELRTFGSPVLIENKTIDEIIPLLQPLDLILQQGHVFFLLNQTHCIESRLGKGVITTPIEERLLEISSSRTGLNSWDPSRDGTKQWIVRRLP